MYAEAANSTSNVSIQFNQKETYSLRPLEFQQALAQADSNMLRLFLYAENIQKQPEIQVSGLHVDNATLRVDMIRHQQLAKEHANDWGTVEKTIVDTNQNIIQFNGQFQSQYEQLLMVIQQKQTSNLQSHIKTLFDCISQNKRESDQLIRMLQTFQSSIEVDVRNFKKDISTLLPIINSDTGWIANVQNQIQSKYAIIKKNKDILWDLISSGRADKKNLADTRNKIATASADIEKLKASLSGVQAEVVNLVDTQNNLTDMIQAITAAIQALQYLSTQWSMIQIKYEAVLNTMDQIDPEIWKWIQSDLIIAKKEWQDLTEYAKKLQQLYTNERKEIEVLQNK
ncbi:TPA: HBL/NHE enterotoxin family protein [Bacillus cereus]